MSCAHRNTAVRPQLLEIAQCLQAADSAVEAEVFTRNIERCFDLADHLALPPEDEQSQLSVSLHNFVSALRGSCSEGQAPEDQHLLAFIDWAVTLCNACEQEQSRDATPCDAASSECGLDLALRRAALANDPAAIIAAL